MVGDIRHKRVFQHEPRDMVKLYNILSKVNRLIKI